ncbi:CHAT domain-containing protein [Aggregatilinea lenta]|uniref:CHAT domain-containing protein n=1 Tax=Aggregatilinea lenta TaxID=913108 RepID=UPI000E5AE2F8|nr:CHAT domain-containing protein [Aggregatilinea lenta]
MEFSESQLPTALALIDAGPGDYFGYLSEVLSGMVQLDLARSAYEFFVRHDPSVYSLYIIDQTVRGEPFFPLDDVGLNVVETLIDEADETPILFLSTADIDESNHILERHSNCHSVPRFVRHEYEIPTLVELLIRTASTKPKSQVRLFITYWLDPPAEHLDGESRLDAVLNMAFCRTHIVTVDCRYKFNRVDFPGDIDTLRAEIKASGFRTGVIENSSISIPNNSEIQTLRIGLEDIQPKTEPHRKVSIHFFSDTGFLNDLRFGLTARGENLGSRTILLSQREVPQVHDENGPRHVLELKWHKTTEGAPYLEVAATFRYNGKVHVKPLGETKLTLGDYTDIRERLENALKRIELKAATGEIFSTVPETVEKSKELFEAGQAAFYRIFSATDRGLTRKLQDFFERSQSVFGQKPEVRVDTDSLHLIPFELLYTAPLQPSNEFQLNRLWAMGAVVKQLLPNQDYGETPVLSSSSRINFAFIRNTKIEAPLRYELPLLEAVSNHIDLYRWEKDKHDPFDLAGFLRAPYQILQITGHGTRPPGESINLGGAYLTPEWFLDNNIMLGDRPLVILNACEGVAIDPEYTKSFLTALFKAGAQGILGPHTRVGTYFASRFVTSFLRYFLSGMPANDALQRTRQECFLNTGHLTGLLYTYYGHPSLSVENYIPMGNDLNLCSKCLILGCVSEKSETI